MTSLVEQVTYTVCFCDSEYHPFKPILKHGFSHCFAFKHTEDYYIVANSELSHIELDVLERNEQAFNDLIESMVTVTVTLDIDAKHSIAGLRWLSCVETVKSLLGIRSPLLLTPYQLYKRLVRCQGKVPQNAQPKTNAN